MRSIRPFDLDTRACFRFQVGQGCGKRLWRVRRLVIYGNDEVVGTNPGTICMSERRVILRHALRSALTPVVTQFGIDLATLLGGAIVTENVFGLPGLG